MELKVKKLRGDAIMPAYALPGDSGLDLFSIENLDIEPGCHVLVRTGIAIELPEGTEGQVRPRSGLALKHGVSILNTPGTIDSGYRGEVGVIMINHGKHTFSVRKGMKIAQLVIQRVFRVAVVESEDLSGSGRGAGGFGSTGV